MLTEEITTGTSVKPLDAFAKLFNTGHRRPTSKGDEYRVSNLDEMSMLAQRVIKDNNLPLTIVRNNSLNTVRSFVVVEI